MFEWQKGAFTVRISLLFPAMLVVMLMPDDSRLTALCLLAALIHEAGHFLMMLAVKDAPKRITFGAFGARIERQNKTLGYQKSALVSLAGPLANLLCAAGLFMVFGFCRAALAHLVLGIFNLLPIRTLDGGEALYALLCHRYPEEKGAVILRAVSAAVWIPLFALGVFLFVKSGNLSLAGLSLYLLFLVLLQEKD